MLVTYILCFSSEYVAFALLVHIQDNLFPEYVREYQSNYMDGADGDVWNAARASLSQACKHAFNFVETDAKFVNAFILNEGREMISTLFIKDINF